MLFVPFISLNYRYIQTHTHTKTLVNHFKILNHLSFEDMLSVSVFCLLFILI